MRRSEEKKLKQFNIYQTSSLIRTEQLHQSIFHFPTLFATCTSNLALLDSPNGTLITSCAYPIRHEYESSFTSFRTLRGGVRVGDWLLLCGLEMRLGEGRLLWVANTRICALRGHNGGQSQGASLSPRRGTNDGRNINPLSH